MTTTDLYREMKAAEAKYDAIKDGVDGDYTETVAMIIELEIAEKLYAEAQMAASQRWEAIPESDAKSSAENNAFDTEGTDEDKLRWYEIAIGTYLGNMESGDFDAAGLYL